MTSFITRLDPAGDRPAGQLRMAVKDLIDMVGLPTTAGCRAVADRATPAIGDAECLAGIRAGEAQGVLRIVGKTNLHELAFGVTGINPWFGTPVNPLDARLIPGGSSSGSGVVVGTEDADVALGSDTGGSIRIPAACCGVAGLKTTWGRVSLQGVWPLAPSFDTVGPMARDVAGLVRGMELLEPGFAVASEVPLTIGRVRVPARPDIDAAIDRALAEAELDVTDIDLPGWVGADQAGLTLLNHEAWKTDEELVAAHPQGIGADVALRLAAGSTVTEAQLAAARGVRESWKAQLRASFDRVQLLALPTLGDLPPTADDQAATRVLRYTIAANLAGVPALSVPVPMGGPIPASLQLIGPPGSEEALLAAGGRIEQALR